ncbi:hypothetical protein G9A89_014320 [Geosiphon pyriformis]|nr:hypothetical protein G9A89_014320 [Geosiphon pyriformis]
MDGTEKLRLANEMTSGIACLHAENIIHRDLNSLSILIHNNSIKISDLGLAKHLKDISGKSSKVFGQIFYVEPQYLLNYKYIRNEKSDIYALGMLLWELSSGRPPCFNIGSIVNGIEVLDRLNQIEWISSYNSFSNYTTVSLSGISSEKGDLDIQKNLKQSDENGLGTAKNFGKALNSTQKQQRREQRKTSKKRLSSTQKQQKQEIHMHRTMLDDEQRKTSKKPLSSTQKEQKQEIEMHRPILGGVMKKD